MNTAAALAALQAHRAQIAVVVSELVPSAWREEGEQVGAIGLLVALKELGAGFDWAQAEPTVRNEVRTWLDSGVYWRGPAGGVDPFDAAAVERARAVLRAS